MATSMQKLNLLVKTNVLAMALLFCQSTLADTLPDYDQALALKLSINTKNSDEKRLAFKVTLVNKTEKTLTINVPSYEGQLDVYREPINSTKEYMAHLIQSINGRCNDSAKTLTLASKSELTYSRTIDLPKKSKHSTAQPIAYKAVFEFYKTTKSNSGITSIQSNTVHK
jgi:hypothetical protein